MSAEKQKQSDDAVALLSNVFRRMCNEERIPVDQRRIVPFGFFIAWASTNWDGLPSYEIAQEVGVDENVWAFVTDMLHGGGRGIGLLWPRIVMCDAPAPKHVVKSIAMQLFLTWEDGTIVPIQAHVPRELCGQDGITDPVVVAIGSQVMGSMLDTVMREGLDHLHDNAGDNYGGEEQYNIMIGAFMQIIPQLKQSCQPYAEKYLRLLRRMFRPEISAEVQAKIDAANKARSAVTSVTRATGGWDVG